MGENPVKPSLPKQIQKTPVFSTIMTYIQDFCVIGDIEDIGDIASY